MNYWVKFVAFDSMGAGDMNITITINSNNSAFQPDSELVTYILEGLARRIEHGGLDKYILWDINGNKVGEMKVKKS